MEYDVVIRYEPLLPDKWEDITVTIIRPGPIDHTGPCAGSHPSDDIKRVSLPSNSRSAPVFPPTCLEAGQVYKVRLDFNSYAYDKPTPTAAVLIDSVSLLVVRIK